MEGFLDIRLKPWLRRLITRSIAIIPAAVVIGIAGDNKVTSLLILSQVILSFQLPFAVIPLIQFTAAARKWASSPTRAWFLSSPGSSLPPFSSSTPNSSG